MLERKSISHQVCLNYDIKYVYSVVNSAVYKRRNMSMLFCAHEEVDSRTCIQVKYALNKGDHNISICKVDTDVLVIFVSVFFSLQDIYPDT